MVSESDGRLLLKLARASVEAALSSGGEETGISFPELKKRFSERRGVFVTLKKSGMLRGCIGYPEPVLPLYDAVIGAARSAAFRDPRFAPLGREELGETEFEVSVLTLPEELKAESPEDYPEKIKIGRDGLIIRGESSGLLLPQVAVECGFSQRAFLECVCEKAGLDRDAWKRKDNRIYTFRAEVFSEAKS